MNNTRLGAKLVQWFREFFAYIETTKLGGAFLHFFGWYRSTLERITIERIRAAIDTMKAVPVAEMHMGAVFLALVSGEPIPTNPTDAAHTLETIVKDPSGYIKAVALYMANNPLSNEIADILGTIIEDIVITPIEDFVGNNPTDPHKFLVRMHGKLAGVTLAAHVLSMVAEVVGVGQIETVATAIHDTLSSLGLDNIGATMIEPLVSNTIRMQETRYYNERYRMRRWTAPELMQLYALREISEADFYKQMGEWGYRNEDIGKALHNSELKVGFEALIRGYKLNVLDKAGLADYLHKQGYRPEAVDFLIKLEDEAKRSDDLNSIAGIALQAFKKGLLSEQQYRQMRSNARVPNDRIDIEVQLAQLEMQTVHHDLSVSNIKAAFMQNVIALKEADNYLEGIGTDATARALLLATWQEEKAPKVLRLNSNTILSAYAAGVIDRNDTISKLKGIGWSASDAELQVRVTEQRFTGKERPLSEGAILTAFNNGILDDMQAISRLMILNYSKEDAALIIQMSSIKPNNAGKLLSEARVIKLYQLGVFGYVDAINGLVMLGYDEQTAELALIADTTKAPPKQTLTQ